MEIIKQIDELNFQKWRFHLIGNTLVLSEYQLLQKESKRHRTFKTLQQYDRIQTRANTILEENVPLSKELKTEVLNKYMSTIKVIKWSER